MLKRTSQLTRIELCAESGRVGSSRSWTKCLPPTSLYDRQWWPNLVSVSATCSALERTCRSSTRPRPRQPRLRCTASSSAKFRIGEAEPASSRRLRRRCPAGRRGSPIAEVTADVALLVPILAVVVAEGFREDGIKGEVVGVTIRGPSAGEVEVDGAGSEATLILYNKLNHFSGNFSLLLL